MSFNRMLAEADPETAARSAVRMARATVHSSALSAATRVRAQSLIDIGVDELARRIREARKSNAAQSVVANVTNVGGPVSSDVNAHLSILDTDEGETTQLPAVPLEDKILVRVGNPSTTERSGLLIPNAMDKSREGKVVAVGPGRWNEDGERRIPLDVAEGDVIIYSKSGGTEIKYSGEKYLITSAHDALAVVSGPDRRPRTEQ